ncbi:MAG: hypothetical protein ACI8WB_001390 [Phenylobacterium sp.]|jgi:hypothetical protein
MHYVERSDCPELLDKNRAQWTQPWLYFYMNRTKADKPTDGYWRKDEIRFRLIDDFHNNCGYCGKGLPTRRRYEDLLLELAQLDQQERQFASKGDVDHFLPKAVYPALVYCWANYVWSCKECNQQKRDFESREHPLFNPCHVQDCQQLQYNEDSGLYKLSEPIAMNDHWRQRWANTQVQTMISDTDIGKERRLKTAGLRDRFESIATYVEMKMEMDSPRLKTMIDKAIDEITRIVKSPYYHLLVQHQYQHLRNEFEQVASLLDADAENQPLAQPF